MKALFALTLVFISSGGFAQVLEEKFDRFKNISIVRWPSDDRFTTEIFKWDSPPVVQFVASFSGQKPERPPTDLDIHIGSSYRTWRYLNCHDVAMLADDKPIKLKPSVHTGQVERRAVFEIVTTSLPYNVAREIAGSGKIEMRICRTEIPITSEMKSAIKEILRVTSPP